MQAKTEIFITIYLFVFSTTFSQITVKDKASFVKSENTFYENIRKTIKEEKDKKKDEKKVFQMDFSGKSIPRSVDEFTTVWCQQPVSQGNTGTCWCFSTSSFYESEIFRLTGKKIKLSEIYTVYWEYVEKAKEYIRTRGNTFLGEGSETNAVARMMEMYGLVPLDAYSGKSVDQKFHNHQDMFDEIKDYLFSIKRNNGWNENAVIETVKTILNHYLGAPPVVFNYENKNYTPAAFLKEVCKIIPSDYVNFMSLMELPYWTKGEYKVPDNWWHSKNYYNIPLDDFMNLIKTSLKSNFSVVIGGDVSESGHISTQGLAMVPSYDIPSEYIDENARQFRFTNGTTTDDHAIHVTGYKTDGKEWWFLIKDSGSGAQSNINKGWTFYHEDYIKLKIMNFTVHKDAVKEVLKKMN